MKHLCKLICSVLLCLVVASICFSQTEQNGDAEPVSGHEAETRLLISPETDSQDGNAVPVSDTPSTVWMFVRMIFVLIVVVACIYGIVFFLRKGMMPAQKADPYLKVTASLTLSPGKFLYVVTLNAQGFLIGVTDNAINLIAELTDKELIDAMNLHAEQQPQSVPRDFASILNFFHPAKKAETTKEKKETVSDLFSDSTENTVQVLQQQRARLHMSESEEIDTGDIQ